MAALVLDVQARGHTVGDHPGPGTARVILRGNRSWIQFGRPRRGAVEPSRPALEERLDVRLAQAVADGLEGGGVGTREKPVVQRRKREIISATLGMASSSVW